MGASGRPHRSRRKALCHAAKRELLEETGYTATNWRRILYFYASPGFVAETMSVYLATGFERAQLTRSR